MRSLYRAAALITVISLASGCTGSRRFDRYHGDVRLPSAPVLEPNPNIMVDPDTIGTAGDPAPGRARDDFSNAPSLTPFGE